MLRMLRLALPVAVILALGGVAGVASATTTSHEPDCTFNLSKQTSALHVTLRGQMAGCPRGTLHYKQELVLIDPPTGTVLLEDSHTCYHSTSCQRPAQGYTQGGRKYPLCFTVRATIYGQGPGFKEHESKEFKLSYKNGCG
jgi:hypothetical protein